MFDRWNDSQRDAFVSDVADGRREETE